MTRAVILASAPMAALLLSGCLAKAALDVATAPVRVAGKAVDMATTSQSERDEKRGRELRQREERYGKLGREYGKQRRKCEDGDSGACERAGRLWSEMDALRATIPAEPERR
jgi:hypothetical protein